MPIYAYACTDCGPFEAHRPAAEASAAGRCPSCGGAARRVFTPPGLPLLARPLRRALDGEERSGHEPAVVSTTRGAPMPHHHDPAPPWVLSH